GHAALAVVLVPAFVDGDLRLVAAVRDGGGVEGVDAVAVDVLQPGAEAAWVPIAGAAECVLEAAGDGGDNRVFVVSDPVALMVVIELDARSARQIERDIIAAGHGVQAVVLGPAIVNR